ncbi:hypothetical protein Tco_0146531 [Tanacetum coccineum]
MVDGIWVDNPHEVKNEFFEHFSSRFQHPCTKDATIVMDFPNVLSGADRQKIEGDVTNDEIKKAVWDCGTDKAPGPDGFTFGFFRRYWDLIMVDVTNAVSQIGYRCSCPHYEVLPHNVRISYPWGLSWAAVVTRHRAWIAYRRSSGRQEPCFSEMEDANSLSTGGQVSRYGVYTHKLTELITEFYSLVKSSRSNLLESSIHLNPSREFLIRKQYSSAGMLFSEHADEFSSC